MRATVFTDGACLGNPGPGGWAYAVPDVLFRSGFDNPSTNQRMEITAALRAVEDIEGDLEVVSDSTYVVNCFRQGWWRSWLSNGWRTTARKPVANRDLWEPLITEVTSGRRSISFRWTKGHGTDTMNDLVDRLAAEAARTQRGRLGTGTPEDVGAPDRAGDVTAPGRRVAVFGHRPPELDGWEGGAVSDVVRRRLSDILYAKARLNGDVVVVTGLNQGVEQMAAEAGLPYVAVLAFPGQEDPWPAAARARYERLLAGAAQVVTVRKDKPADKPGFAKAYAARDGRILDLADEAVVVWDGSTGPVKRQIDQAKKALGEEDVWVVELGELR